MPQWRSPQHYTSVIVAALRHRDRHLGTRTRRSERSRRRETWVSFGSAVDHEVGGRSQTVIATSVGLFAAAAPAAAMAPAYFGRQADSISEKGTWFGYM